MITLLSDFGDLIHEVPPQDILAARFNLMMAYPYFPIGTVHLAVVDVHSTGEIFLRWWPPIWPMGFG
jgi:S-adenosylmethionine hydrolase